jgi:methionyl-tRNA formyltransferase
VKIVFIGCVEFSFNALVTLLQNPKAEIVGILTRRTSPSNSDFQSLESIAQEKSIPYVLAEEKTEAEILHWMKSASPDVAYCFGWSKLLKSEFLSLPRLGIVGFHPAKLPQNRGRHPLIWALALGLKETASTFFFMDEGADSGDILSQEGILITESDDAKSLYAKMTDIALKQIHTFTQDLAAGQIQRKKQEHALTNHWRKRSKLDGTIDWRMPATGIHNLVRALARPYPGAHFVSMGQEIKLWKTRIQPEAPANFEAGKVLSIHGKEITIKCGTGAICLIDHELKDLPQKGSYL